MLPKERVLQALHHHQPDRVPVGEIGIDYTITEQALGHPTLYRAKWKEYQALWQGRRDEYVESCRRDIVGLARKFEWDFVPVFLVPPRNTPARLPKFLDEYTWEEPDGRIMQFSPETEGHAVCVQYPPLSLETLKEQPVYVDPSQLDLVEHVVRELGTTHFILGRGEDGTFPHERYGLTQLLMGMIDEPTLVHKVIEIETRKAIVINEALLNAGCDAVLPGDDYCSAKGPMMSPGRWKEFIFPALRALCESAHRKGKYLIKHTDGKTWSILDMLLDAGIDGGHGIQATAGMDLAPLKNRYGDRVCFWGGVDVDWLDVDWLVEGTPEQVRAATRYAIESVGDHGGLVLTSGNTLMVGVRYENYLAMLQAARLVG